MGEFDHGFDRSTPITTDTLSSGDRFEYVASLIAELREMTRGEPGAETLSGILRVAEAEAQRLARHSGRITRQV